MLSLKRQVLYTLPFLEQGLIDNIKQQVFVFLIQPLGVLGCAVMSAEEISGRGSKEFRCLDLSIVDLFHLSDARMKKK